MKLKFENLRFEEEPDRVKVIFLKIFYSYIDKAVLGKIGDYKIGANFIEISGNEDVIAKRFDFLLSETFQHLKNSVSDHKTVYIHKNSGIPLIGSNSFGIVDRDTNLIELKPITSCNLNCIYCSVDEGISSKKLADYVVEESYLAEETKKIVDFKGEDNIHIHIGTQGEPLLYADLIPLVKDLRKISQIKKISLSTNGTMLDEKTADELVEAGLTQFNISINSTDEKKSFTLAGCKYDFKKTMKSIKYIAEKKYGLILTPVWVPGYNDKDIEALVRLSKKLGCGIGIQNFLNYKYGRNPVKAMPWQEFYEKMALLEKKHKIKLVGVCHDFKETKHLPKPFRKDDRIDALVMAEGRVSGEMLAVAKERTITIPKCSKKIGEKVTLKITRSKHNIFYASCS